ncbi:SH3 domain-containing protein [Lyngbya sp. PCC 8106]|uniref:SH3 domain-containing protein n=1 Tax=Lyngbya sp. (strain PCC 8106) TaxID=313612 RepID=UPI0000EA97AD|nr:SH3 domain-containing protein [Lyngbya sp. PCC 8106]EAW36829.1 hypothetical protein L8106_26747 [Lyngbya sp. PCC 8106]
MMKAYDLDLNSFKITLGLTALGGLATTLIMPVESAKAQTSTVPGSNCREAKITNLIIRDKPGGNEIGRLQEGENVYIANEGRNGWVPIENPASGYVNAKNLRFCTGADSLSEVPDGEALLTPPVNGCREVNASLVTLRDRPQGKIISTLERDEKVYIEDEGENGWVQVQYPIEGYVTSANLAYCDTVGSTFPTSSCREVNVNTRLNVRSQPGGEIIGSLEAGQDISIENRGKNGWVPVFAPIEGYVAANFLELCP